MPALEKNHIYRSTIEGYSSEGLGVARIDGQVVFVHDAVRGEDCDILVMKVLKNVAFGKPVLRHSTSPYRQEPDCPYYGRCGGCDFRHLDYAEELWAKRQRVQDALTRLGGSDVTVEEILGAAQPLRYRNKSQYPVSADGRVGFYRARSHQVVEVEHCLLRPCGSIWRSIMCRDTTRPPAGGWCGTCMCGATVKTRALCACW